MQERQPWMPHCFVNKREVLLATFPVSFMPPNPFQCHHIISFTQFSIVINIWLLQRALPLALPPGECHPGPAKWPPTVGDLITVVHCGNCRIEHYSKNPDFSKVNKC